MDLRRFLSVLARRWFLIAFAAIVAATAGWFTWRLLPPAFEATALLHVPTPPVGVDWFQYDHNHSDRMINFYVTLGESRSVQESLLRDLGVEKLPDYAVEPVPNSGLVEVTSSGATPEAAARAANALSAILISLDEGLPESLSDSNLVPSLRLVEAAVPPEKPAGLGLPLVLILATFVGGVVGLLLALLAENVDQRLHFIEDIAFITDTPVLAAVPLIRRRRRTSLAPTDSVHGRAYRRLRAQLIARTAEERLGVVVVAAPEAGHGASTTVVNLAAVLGAGGRNVLVLDCARTGSELLETLIATDRQVKAVTRAFNTSSSARAVAPLDNVRRMRTTAAKVPAVLENMEGNGAVILIDAGAIPDSMNVLKLARLADAVVLVVRLGSITGPVLADARDQLRSVNAKFLGVVVTGSNGNNYRPRGSSGAETWRPLAADSLDTGTD